MIEYDKIIQAELSKGAPDNKSEGADKAVIWFLRHTSAAKSRNCIALFLDINPFELVFSGCPLTTGVAASQTDHFPSRFTGFL